FVANIPGECTTANGVLNIPNPGKFGKVLEQPAKDSEGSCPKAAGIPTFDGASAAPAAPAPPAGAPPAPTTFLTRVSSAKPPATPPASASATPIVVVPVTPSAQPAAPAAGNGEACSPDGAIVCLGEGKFGICDHGRAVPQALAPGTKCANGVIS